MQPTREDHIAAHERQLAGIKKQIQESAELEKLINTPLFRKVILQRFCVEECATFAQLSADPSLNDQQRADALGLAQAAGHLRRWIAVIQQKGDQAKGAIPRLEENLLELREAPDEDFNESVEFH